MVTGNWTMGGVAERLPQHGPQIVQAEVVLQHQQGPLHQTAWAEGHQHDRLLQIEWEEDQTGPQRRKTHGHQHQTDLLHTEEATGVAAVPWAVALVVVADRSAGAAAAEDVNYLKQPVKEISIVLNEAIKQLQHSSR